MVSVMGTKNVVLMPIPGGPIIALIDEKAFVSDEEGQLQRCTSLRDALEQAGWVYVGHDTTRH
jgi:hypothetical protein